MRVHKGHISRCKARLLQGRAYGSGQPPPLRMRCGKMVRIRCVAVAQHLPKHLGIAVAGVLRAFQNQRGSAFAKIQTFTVAVKGAAGLVRIYHQPRKTRVGHKAQSVCAAAQHALALACGDEIHCQTNGVRA